LLEESDRETSFPPGFHAAKVFKTGKIPWRNIRHFDARGDDYYSCPHLYCLYAENGMPYEGFSYYLIGGDQYEFELQSDYRVQLDVLLNSAARPSNQRQSAPYLLLLRRKSLWLPGWD
jgi:hypothetical protein